MIKGKALLAWYDRVKRDMPWRHTKDPYAIWLSEVMLQQTRVETVVVYWKRFLAKWPTAAALADAPLDEVLAAWAGLGYYARARNLHAAAKQIRDRHAGRFPSDPAAVRALPGIGRYTAGAILSIAFGQPAPLVDGNVVRVLARLNRLRGHAKDRRLHERCWEIAGQSVPEARPGDFNQALMELGATVCTPRSPQCNACPVAADCRAKAAGHPERIPATPPKAKRPHRLIEAAYVTRGSAILLVRRADFGLLGGLWELPSEERRKSKPGHSAAKALAQLGLKASPGGKVAEVDHAFSHFDMTLEAFACDATGRLTKKIRAEFVAREKLSHYGMGAATKRAIDQASSFRRAPRARRGQPSGLPHGSRPNRSTKSRLRRACSSSTESGITAAQRKTRGP